MALEIRVDLFPLVRILNDGTIYRFMGTDTVPPENSGVLVTSHDITLDATKGVYVRVYVPTTTCQIGEKLPVVVYIHGGGFCIESAASPTYHNLKIDAALPFQTTVALELDRRFGFCLPAGDAPGGIFFGTSNYLKGPDKEFPYIKLNYTFIHTVKYPREYYLNVNSIQVNGKKLAIDPELLRLSLQGSGRTKLSTVVSYMQASKPIYASIRDTFIKEAEAMGISRMESVKPFEAFFDPTTAGSTKTRPAVPLIDLVLDNEYVFWRIHGANSMVKVKEGVMCLAFVEAWKYLAESIVVGSHHLVDNCEKSTIAVIDYQSPIINYY